jgi:hypothetical protein
MEYYSWSNTFFHSYSQGPGQDTSRGPYQLGRFDSKLWQTFKPGYFKIAFTRKLHIFTVYQKLHPACPDWHGFFFSGSVDQCAVVMIEKWSGIYVNLGGMMVTGFGYHCEQDSLSSNPGVILVTFSFFFVTLLSFSHSFSPSLSHSFSLTLSQI